jgi:hypothetical protein
VRRIEEEWHGTEIPRAMPGVGVGTEFCLWLQGFEDDMVVPSGFINDINFSRAEERITSIFGGLLDATGPETGQGASALHSTDPYAFLDPTVAQPGQYAYLNSAILPYAYDRESFQVSPAFVPLFVLSAPPTAFRTAVVPHEPNLWRGGGSPAGQIWPGQTRWTVFNETVTNASLHFYINMWGIHVGNFKVQARVGRPEDAVKDPRRFQDFETVLELNGEQGSGPDRLGWIELNAVLPVQPWTGNNLAVPPH